MKGTERNAFGRALEKFYVKKRELEEGHLRHLVSTILQPLYSSCICTAENAFDKFSFIIRNLYIAVFNFFGTKVRKAPDINKDVKTDQRSGGRRENVLCMWLCATQSANGSKRQTTSKATSYCAARTDRGRQGRRQTWSSHPTCQHQESRRVIICL